jgi:hypothetical protein
LDETAKQFGVTSIDAKDRLHNLCGQFQRLHLKVKKRILLKLELVQIKFTSLTGTISAAEVSRKQWKGGRT